MAEYPQTNISSKNAKELIDFLLTNMRLSLKSGVNLDDILDIERGMLEFGDSASNMYDRIIFSEIKDLILKYLNIKFEWQLKKEDIPEDVSKALQAASSNKDDGITGYSARFFVNALNYMKTHPQYCFKIEFDQSRFYYEEEAKKKTEELLKKMSNSPKRKQLEEILKSGLKLKQEVQNNLDRYFVVEFPEKFDYMFQRKIEEILKEENYIKNDWKHKAKIAGVGIAALILGILGKDCGDRIHNRYEKTEPQKPIVKIEDKTIYANPTIICGDGQMPVEEKDENGNIVKAYCSCDKYKPAAAPVTKPKPEPREKTPSPQPQQPQMPAPKLYGPPPIPQLIYPNPNNSYGNK
ncbi:MAG: hypothetical protein N3D84_02610 [Candidatus Woesearchaeota archaeon]|nr:hypothetical protein [Candidatus Woesearchaeota archaeon]